MTRIDRDTAFETLRKKAQALVDTRPQDTAENRGGDVAEALHELKVHQIELEMQNEELREAQRDLEIAKDLYFQLFNQAPVGYAILDFNGMVRMANSTLANMLGSDPASLKRQPFAKHIATESQHTFFANLALMARARQPKTLEVALTTRAGERLPVQVGMETVAATLFEPHPDQDRVILVTLSDISEIKSAQTQIQQAKKEWEQTFDSVSELIAVIDENHRITRVNRALSDKLGLTPQACIGEPCYKLLHDLDSPPSDCPHLKLLRDGEFHRVERYEALLNGHYLTSVSPLESNGQQTTRCIHVSHEITDLKAIEAERLENERKIQRLQKIEAIGTLAGGVAHDFNNILSIILGNVELSLDDLSSENPTHARLQEVHTATLRAQQVVRQLLSFARETRQDKKVCRLADVVAEAIQLLRASLPATTRIIVDLSERPITVNVDATQLQQVVINLCTNAAHAMEPDGGKLMITLNEISVTPDDRTARPMPPGDYAALSVIDTGHGIPADHLEKIFEPYFTTKAVGKGSGMGLAMVDGIVKDHGGHIEVKSQIDRGTQFTIYLPLIKARSSLAATPLPEIPGGTERVLIVDDEPSLGKLVKAMLSRLGYETHYEQDPRQALERFTAEPNHWQLIISDMTMPHLTGDHLIQSIRELNPTIATVLYTGFNERISKAAAFDIGADQYLEKPVELRKLAVAVRAAIDKSAETG